MKILVCGNITMDARSVANDIKARFPEFFVDYSISFFDVKKKIEENLYDIIIINNLIEGGTGKSVLEIVKKSNKSMIPLAYSMLRDNVEELINAGCKKGFISYQSSDLYNYLKEFYNAKVTISSKEQEPEKEIKIEEKDNEDFKLEKDKKYCKSVIFYEYIKNEDDKEKLTSLKEKYLGKNIYMILALFDKDNNPYNAIGKIIDISYNTKDNNLEAIFEIVEEN